MSMHYSDPSRESDPHAVRDIEVFYVSEPDAAEQFSEPGWFWWACFPGCLPDGEPIGPFDSEEDALADVREMYVP